MWLNQGVGKAALREETSEEHLSPSASGDHCGSLACGHTAVTSGCFVIAFLLFGP